jgi:hypothetical protein
MVVDASRGQGICSEFIKVGMYRKAKSEPRIAIRTERELKRWIKNEKTFLDIQWTILFN